MLVGRAWFIAIAAESEDAALPRRPSVSQHVGCLQPTALLVSTGISAARYSAEPCRSLFRLLASIFTPSQALPDQLAASLSSNGLARNTPLPPAPVTATRTPPLPLATNTPTSAKRDAGCLNFCQPAFSGAGKLTAVMTSPSLSAVWYSPVKKSSAAIVRLSVWIVALSARAAAG